MRIHRSVPFILPHPLLHRRPMLLFPSVLLLPRRLLIPPSRRRVPTSRSSNTPAHRIRLHRLLRRRPSPPPPQKPKHQPRGRHHAQRDPHRQSYRQPLPMLTTIFIHTRCLVTPQSRLHRRRRRRRTALRPRLQRRSRRRDANRRHPPRKRRVRDLDDGLHHARGERERVARRVARAAAGVKVGFAAKGGGGLAAAAGGGEGSAGDEFAVGVVVCVGGALVCSGEGEVGGGRVYQDRSSRRRCCPILGWCRRRAGRRRRSGWGSRCLVSWRCRGRWSSTSSRRGSRRRRGRCRGCRGRIRGRGRQGRSSGSSRVRWGRRGRGGWGGGGRRAAWLGRVSPCWG